MFQQNVFIKTGGGPDSTPQACHLSLLRPARGTALLPSAQALGSSNTVIFFQEVFVLTYGLKKCEAI